MHRKFKLGGSGGGSSSKFSAIFKKRTFVQFVLEPKYKIYAHTLGSSFQELCDSLKKKDLHLDQTAAQFDFVAVFLENMRGLWPWSGTTFPLQRMSMPR